MIFLKHGLLMACMLKIMIYATYIMLIFFFQNKRVELNIITVGAVNSVLSC